MDRLKELIMQAEVLITKKQEKKKKKKSLYSAEIDKAKVKKAGMSIAKKAFGDKTDPKKVDGMVKKAIGLAKDTEDAIGIIQGFFQEK